MSGICYRKGYERGAWFEIRSVKATIESKEGRGEDATFERGLLKSWARYQGYEGAKDALMAVDTREKLKSGGVN